MAQYDVYVNPTVAQRDAFPYLVVLQSDLLERYPTRLMMPLSRMPSAGVSMPRRLSLTVEVGGERLLLASHLCAPLTAKLLSSPVASLRADAGTIRDALDAVINGV